MSAYLYKRVLLKLSGEALQGDAGYGIDPKVLDSLARQIKEINPRVNIIFITVYPEREYAKDVLRLRASGYVRKPFSAAELKKEFDNLRYSVK